MIPVYKVEVGEEFTGATVIEPNKGSVLCVFEFITYIDVVGL